MLAEKINQQEMFVITCGSFAKSAITTEKKKFWSSRFNMLANLLDLMETLNQCITDPITKASLL